MSLHVSQDLTGLESMDQCRRTLEQHNWNIEVQLLHKWTLQESQLAFHGYVYIFITRHTFCGLDCLDLIHLSHFLLVYLMYVFQAAVQDRLNEQEGVPSVFNPPPSRPLQVNTADHRVYSYIVSRPQPRVGLQAFMYVVRLMPLHSCWILSLHSWGYGVPVTMLCKTIVNAWHCATF